MSWKAELPIALIEERDFIAIVNPGNKIETVDYSVSPLKPFMLVESNLSGEPMYEMGTGRKLHVVEQEFKSWADLKEAHRRAPRNVIVRNHVMYKPDLIREVAVPGELKIMCFDFEMGSEGSFPVVERNPIIGWGAYFLGGKYLNPEDNDIIIKINREDEHDVLNAFIDLLVTEQPDLVIGYYSSGFDIPYFYKRCQILGINVARLDRYPMYKDESGLFTGPDGDEHLTMSGRNLGLGRVHDDIFENSVKTDVFIHKQRLKNKRLKTVARAYGLKHIYDLSEGEKANLYTLPLEELTRYLVSDLRCTAHLGMHYIQNTLALSRILGWPLDMTVNRTAGKLADIYCGQAGYKKKWISLRRNEERFPAVYRLIDGSEVGKLEGALNWAHEPTTVQSMQKLDFACVDEETEILTLDGWIPFPKLKITQEVACFNPNNDQIIYRKPEHIHQYDYDGEMIAIQNKLTDQLLTPNHRCLWKSARKRKPKVKKDGSFYSNLKWDQDYQTTRADEIGPYISIPVAGTPQNATLIERRDLFRAYLLGIIITEGWRAKGSDGIYICQTDANKKTSRVIKHIDQSIQRLGYKDQVKRKIRIRRKERTTGEVYLQNEVVWFFPAAFAREKILPAFDGEDIHTLPLWIFRTNLKFMNIMFQSLMDGDGTWKTRDSGAFGSKRKQLADRFQILCVLTGKRSKIKKSKTHKCMYYVSVHRSSTAHVGLNTSYPTKDKLFRKVSYKGKVYCVSNRSGYMVCRRNGTPFITGNSLYPSIMMQFNLSPDTVKLLDTRPLDDEEFVSDPAGIGMRYSIGYEDRGDHEVFSIPDGNVRKRFIVAIDKNPGFVKEFVQKFRQIRKNMKTEMKTAEKGRKSELDANQNSVKIIMNSLFGAMIPKHFMNTSPFIGAFIMAVGRETARMLHRKYEDEMLAIDTDGFMFKTRDISAEDANEKVSSFLRSKYNRDEIFLILEEEYDMSQEIGIMLSKKKNYFLYKKGEVTAVGSSLVNSRQPKFVDHLTLEVVKKVFEDVNSGSYSRTKVRGYELTAFDKLQSLPASDFKMSLNVSRDIAEYQYSGLVSERISKILENPSIKLEEKKSEILQLIKTRVKMFEIEDEVAVPLIRSIVKLNRLALKKYTHGIMELCYRDLDPMIGRTYGQAARLLDLYHAKHGSYPIVGESIEYYYSREFGNVNLADELTDHLDIDMKVYTSMLQRMMRTVYRCLPEPEKETEDLTELF